MASNEHSILQCEVCGKPATVVTGDCKEVPGSVKWLQLQPVGRPHARCDEHPRLPIQYRVHMPHAAEIVNEQFCALLGGILGKVTEYRPISELPADEVA